jgi:hypothetical protein
MSISKSPKRVKRDQRARAAQERRWAGKSGPVTTRIDPELRAAHEARRQAAGRAGRSPA